ncbi:hypothetical protein Dda_8118 [Drechslerella dactyloides]|uniref:Uncharacterized protein n=1 Tax=Drechslerella dactyloides TaxID=74499 RepID=A0AAD6NGA8_DREDA|nr:hypothetical protein Dda_8118 [Drechslerella dactyloides]
MLEFVVATQMPLLCQLPRPPPSNGHDVPELRFLLVIDPTYRAHRRLVRTGIATTVLFVIAFLTWSICFPLALFDLRPLLTPADRRKARIAQTAALAAAALLYIVRGLVNLRVRAFIGRLLRIKKPLGCTQLAHHDVCFNQRYLFYGGWGLELAIASILLMEAILCAFTWTIKL